MKKALIISALALPVLAASAYYVSMIFSEVGLMQEYPHLPQDVVIRAHRISLRRISSGMYNDIDLSTDEACAKLFLSIVDEIYQP